MFQILTEYIAKHSWAEAFEAVIPQRKYEAIGRKGKRKLVGTSGDVVDDAEEDVRESADGSNGRQDAVGESAPREGSASLPIEINSAALLSVVETGSEA